MNIINAWRPKQKVIKSNDIKTRRVNQGLQAKGEISLAVDSFFLSHSEDISIGDWSMLIDRVAGIVNTWRNP
jgi:hypothetical protein